jgi:hypothetical protein
MGDNFKHHEMSRTNLATMYANIEGAKRGFTDKDYEWAETYDSALNKSDDWLHQYVIRRWRLVLAGKRRRVF